MRCIRLPEPRPHLAHTECGSSQLVLVDHAVAIEIENLEARAQAFRKLISLDATVRIGVVLDEALKARRPGEATATVHVVLEKDAVALHDGDAKCFCVVTREVAHRRVDGLVGGRGAGIEKKFARIAIGMRLETGRST